MTLEEEPTYESTESLYSTNYSVEEKEKESASSLLKEPDLKSMKSIEIIFPEQVVVVENKGAKEVSDAVEIFFPYPTLKSFDACRFKQKNETHKNYTDLGLVSSTSNIPPLTLIHDQPLVTPPPLLAETESPPLKPPLKPLDPNFLKTKSKSNDATKTTHLRSWSDFPILKRFTSTKIYNISEEAQGEKLPPEPPPELIFDQPPMKSHAVKTTSFVSLQEPPYQCLQNEFIQLSPLCNVGKKVIPNTSIYQLLVYNKFQISSVIPLDTHDLSYSKSHGPDLSTSSHAQRPTIQFKSTTRLLHASHRRPTRLLPVARHSVHSPIIQKDSFLSVENHHPPFNFPQFMQNLSQPLIQKKFPHVAAVVACTSLTPLTSIHKDFLSLHTKSHSQTASGQKHVASHPCRSCPMSPTVSLDYFTYQIPKAKFNQPHKSGFHKSPNTVSNLVPNSIKLRRIHNHSSSLLPSIINEFTRMNFMFPMIFASFKNTKNELFLSSDTKIFDHKRDCYEQAFKCFRKMQIVGVVPVYVIIMAIIFVCAHLGALGLGLCVHRFAMKKDFRDNVRVSNSLAYICVSYGCMKLALKVFDRMTQQILGLENSIIDSFTQNEFVDEVLSSFYLMRKEEFQSNGVLSIENIHEEVVASIPIIDFWSEKSPMNNTDSIVILAAHSLIKISSENLHSQVGIVVIHGGCPKKGHADFLTKCMIPTRRSFVNMHMKPDTETYNWVVEVYTRADSYDRVQDVAELLGMMVEVHKLIQLPSKLHQILAQLGDNLQTLLFSANMIKLGHVSRIHPYHHFVNLAVVGYRTFSPAVAALYVTEASHAFSCSKCTFYKQWDPGVILEP